MHGAHISRLKHGRSRHKPTSGCLQQALPPASPQASLSKLPANCEPAQAAWARQASLQTVTWTARCRRTRRGRTPASTSSELARSGCQWRGSPRVVGLGVEHAAFGKAKSATSPPTTTSFHHSPSHQFTTLQHTLWSCFSASKFSDKTSPHRPHACPGLLQVERCRHPSLLRALQHKLSADGLLTPAVFQLMK